MIALHGLSKAYEGVEVVRALSLELGRGAIFGLLGANGAGKTTTIRMLCGLTQPTRGHATIAGADTWRQRYRARRHFGYMAQRFSLYPDLTVGENLRFFGGASALPAARLAERLPLLLRQMDLQAKEKTLAGALSGGTKQRLALACALIHDPEVLFLDEPTAGLDPVHRQELWNLLYDLGHAGKTLLVTTHYMDEAERCTEVGFLHHGVLLARDTPDRITHRFRAELLELQVDPPMPALGALQTAPGVLGASLHSGWIRLYAEKPAELLAAWQAHWPFPHLHWRGHRWAAAQMEDVFRAYAQGFHSLLAPQ